MVDSPAAEHARHIERTAVAIYATEQKFPMGEGAWIEWRELPEKERKVRRDRAEKILANSKNRRW